MLVLGILIAITAVALYTYLTWNHNYWKKRGVPYNPPTILVGNMGRLLLGETLFPFILDAYEKFQDCLYFGYFKFLQPGIIIRDPELVEKIQVTEFSSFHDNDFDIDEDLDPHFGKNPFVLRGDRWKIVRKHLVQQFSPAKMKAMFPLMVQVSENLVNYLLNEPDAQGSNGLAARELCTKFTADAVIRCAFNIDARSFTDEKSEIRELGKKIIAPGFINTLKINIGFFLPSLAKKLNIRLIPKEVSEYFEKLIKELIQYRKENNIVVNDFLDAMMKLRERVTEYDFSEEHMVANVITFFTDGFETSAATLGSVFYQLGANPDVFHRLREEVDEYMIKYNGQITYEMIQEMKYLDCVISETLRSHTAAIFLVKVCTKDFNLPSPKGYGKGPDVLVKTGTSVVLPIWSIHHDPNYYPDPHKFDPDRFSDERKHEINKSWFLPFGLGPRTCIGQKFALTQIKAATVQVVSKLDIKINKKTIEPLEFDFKSFVFGFKGGFWLNFYERS